MTDDNKTDVYYDVNWDGPLQKLQEDNDIFQAGDVVYNATHLSPIQQVHHWYTLSIIKTTVHVHHVLADNIDLQKPSSSIKLPNTQNHQKTA